MKKEVSLVIVLTNSSDWAWQNEAENELSTKLSDGFEIEGIIHLGNGRILYTLVKFVNQEED